MQGKRNNGPEMGKEVREFCSLPSFVSELAISVFLIFQGLDLKLWSHSESQKCWLERMCGKSSKSSLLPEEGLSSTQDKVSGFVREP